MTDPNQKKKMKKYQLAKSLKTVPLLATCVLGLWGQSLLKADVVVLESGGVLTGKVLQQDDDGVLIQTESGTHRYPRSWIRDVKKEPASAPHVSNNGQRIPDWAEIVSLLANTGWSQGLKQVPATMIEAGIWKNVPYISFQCRSGGYELNIFGDLNNPAAVQIGAMSYLKQSAEAKSNCVNLICSSLPNADDRKMVRALNWNQKDGGKNEGMTVETIMPGEWGSYGGWWVSVYSEKALAAARASDEELLTLTQPAGGAPQPAVASAQPAAPAAAAAAPSQMPVPAASQADNSAQQPPQAQPVQPVPVTTYQAVPAWSDAELAAARRVGPGPNPVATAAKVYPRTYDRAGGTYAHPATVRR
jgi:hypothetical protein